MQLCVASARLGEGGNQPNRLCTMFQDVLKQVET